MGAARSSGLDVAGVGFGPSNLALAVAIEEHNGKALSGGGRPLASVFFERQPTFRWHSGMLLEDSTIQVSFLKDLVTLRNPSSDFSFVAYLHERGRLADFVNHKALFPLRAEFNDYFAWVAGRLAVYPAYGREVTEVRPVVDGGVITAFDVVTGTATKQVDIQRARNVVVATGLVPHLPDGVALSERVWHTSELLRRIGGLASPPRRVIVVGAGQSAAEATEYLCQRFPSAEVCAVFARFGYSPADDSSFTNRIFDAAAVDTFYSAPEEVKQMLVDYHANTNYSVVDADLIAALYRREYREKVLGRPRLRVHHASRVVDVDETAGGVTVTVEYLPDGRVTRLDSDAVVYGTGYRPSDPQRLLGRAGDLCRRDRAGRLSIGRDHRLDLALASTAGLFVTGSSVHAHGLSSTLLSNVAVRAGEVLESVLANVGEAVSPDPGTRLFPETGEFDLGEFPSLMAGRAPAIEAS